MISYERLPRPTVTTIKGRRLERLRPRIDGRQVVVYLGPEGSVRALDNYLRALRLWADSGYRWTPQAHEAYKAGEDVPRRRGVGSSGHGDHESGPTAAKVAAHYLTWSKNHYIKDGVRTSTYALDRVSVQELINTPGMAATPAAEIQAAEMAAFRRRLENLTRTIRDGETESVVSRYTASTVNRYVGRIRYMLRWAKSEGLIPGTADDVMPAKPGVTSSPGGPELRAGSKRGPAPRETVARVRRALRASGHTPVAAMIALQLRSSMRPAEVCMMRPELIIETDTPSVMIYVPDAAADKIARVGEKAVPVLLGPRCLRCLLPWISRSRTNGDRYVFNPKPYSRRAGNSLDHYTPARYAKIIRDTCGGLDKDERNTASAEGRAPVPVVRFTPYQLRHSGATRLQRRPGASLDDIMRQLRHTQARTTLGYIDPNIDDRLAFAAKHC